MNHSPYKSSTLAVHAGQYPDPLTGAVNVPVYLSSTFQLTGIGTDRGWDYSRAGNPTRDRLEEALAALEGGISGHAFTSGMAAIYGLVAMLRAASVEIDPRIVDVPIALDDLVIYVVGGPGITDSGIGTDVAVVDVLMDAVIASQIAVIYRPAGHTAVDGNILEALIHINVVDADIGTRPGKPAAAIRPAMIVNTVMPPVEVIV